MSDEQAIADIRARQKQAATYWQNQVRKLRPQGLTMAAKIAATVDVPWLLAEVERLREGNANLIKHAEVFAEEVLQANIELELLRPVVEAAKAYRKASDALQHFDGRRDDLGACADAHAAAREAIAHALDALAGQSTADWVDDATTPAAETQRRIEALPKAEVVADREAQAVGGV